MTDLLRLAKELDLPLRRHQRPALHARRTTPTAHAALLCVQSGSTLDDPNRFKFDSDEFYLKIGRRDARRCSATTPRPATTPCSSPSAARSAFEKRDLMPRFPVPEGETEATLVREGGRGRPGTALPARRRRGAPRAGRLRGRRHHADGLPRLLPRRRRLHRVGEGAGHPGRSRPRFGRRLDGRLRHGHHRARPARARSHLRALPQPRARLDARRRRRLRRPSPPRGDPLRHREVRRRPRRPDRHLRHDQGQAGPQGLARACSGCRTRWARSSPRRCRRPSWARTWALGDVFDTTAERYKEAADLRGIVETDPEAERVFDTALGIENLKRQWGVHAAGVLMSAEPLIDVLPIMKREDDGAIITQFDQPPLEDLGLLKMDFLGLRNLTVIEDALRMIETNTGTRTEDRGTRPRRRRGDLRAAGARRHARRLPVRRRADARPAQAAQAHELRGHLGRHRALPARVPWA